MSTGGVFILIANDGKADKMINATDLIRQRMEQVKCARRKARDQGLPGYEDDTPTLVDVERSHILYVNAHFKPFAAIGYEYQRVQPQQGTAQWGQTLQYSIPQFGDFIYDMVLHMQLSEANASTVVPATALVSVPPAYSDTTNGQGTSRTIVHSFYVDPFGNVVWDPNAATVCPGDTNVPGTVPRANYVHYCEFPAMRAVKGVHFTVNGNPLDEYDSNTYAFYEQFRIRPGKRFGWNRSVGQEIPTQGYSDLCISTESNGIANSGDISRRVINVVTGAQTPKPVQPAQDWWLKLLLWFNEDVRLSVPSVSIPYGQRFITIDISNQSDVIFTSAAGLLFMTETTVVTYNGNGTDNYATAISSSCTQTPTLLPGSTVNPVNFTRFDLYINNIFVNPEIHDIYIKRIGFNLIRVHRIQTQQLNSDANQVLLSNLKWPIEYFYAGVKPVENTNNNNGQLWRNWHRFVKTTIQNCQDPTQIEHLLLTSPSSTTNQSSSPRRTCVDYSGCGGNVTYWTSVRPLDTIEISAHQIPIYKPYPTGFYNSYLPLQYGGVNIQTPEDEGCYFINFCLYPGTYQPSGHFNISRAREFYFNYTSSVINAQNTGTLYIDASALNFLLISDGSAVLRYST